ncbi:Sesquiterpene cyclase BOT2-like protein [Cladobotryum mycophilum]|uniref:Terpene synthase n=1 Tax=Cladobotryum mycophilum TaxID=491253 RepID=A0ABR0SEH7_9HYPO
MPSPSQDTIISALRGQTLRIPDLTSLFRSWPPARLNRNHPLLVPLVNEAILKIAARQPLIESRLRDDIALLACLMYPAAERPRVDVLVLFMVWIVCWDDTVDASEGDLAGDFEGAERWRGRTLGVVGAALGLVPLPEGELDPLSEILLDCGREFAQTSSLAGREMLFEQLGKYIRACARIDAPYEAYMSLRKGTIGGDAFCALVPYALPNQASNQDIPSSIVDSPQAGVLADQVNILLALVNDALSLKKELRTGCVINAVAALFVEEEEEEEEEEKGEGKGKGKRQGEKTLDKVVDQVVCKLGEAVRTFDAAAAELVATHSNNAELQSLMQSFVDGHRAIVTGLLEFTLKSPRYNLAQLLRKDGSLEIVL